MSKKRVAIITITELDNFGNRLQNYALQETLRGLGYEVETVHNYITYKNMRSFKYKAVKMLSGILKNKRQNISEIIRKIRFEKFDKQYFAFSKDFSTIDFISPDINKHYDYFVAGSDQIWNPNFSFNFDFNFLAFADSNKRIAYSASFGVDDIPPEKQAEFSQYLNGFKALSVRELTGREIIKDLTGKESSVLLDPTMLLNQSRWKSLEKKPSGFSAKKEYILVYFLGNKDFLKQKTDEALKADKYKHCEIIDISDKNIISHYSIRPDEFVWLIDNAWLVITDSFHATVFSILMNTDFMNLERSDYNISMNSRISSLFNLLNIQAEQGEIFAPSHSLKNDILEEKRNEALHYLKGALN